MFRQKELSNLIRNLLVISLLISGNFSSAKVIEEDFRYETTKNDWYFPLAGGQWPNGIRIKELESPENAACLTAGNGQNKGSATKAGKPPHCQDREQRGDGILRLTPPKTYQGGSIVSNTPFPTNDGVNITFVTYTYGGDGYRNKKDTLEKQKLQQGADGMTFALLDAEAPITMGGLGGALGYACPASLQTQRGSGVVGGYLGIGIDEFGNFSNSENTGYGGEKGRQANVIAVRGAGSVNFEYLHKKYSQYFNEFRGLMETSRACWQGKTLTGYNLLKDKEVGHYPLLEKKDLNELIVNVNAKTRKEAYPISYKISISKKGILNFSYSYRGGVYQPVIKDMDIQEKNGKLPKAFRFAFSAATGGSYNNHEVACFKAASDDASISTSPSSSPDGQFRTGMQVFSSFFNPSYWSGSFTATTLTKTEKGDLIASGQLNWDAGCVLTGGNCETMTKEGTNKYKEINKQKDRLFWTTKNGKGIHLNWNALDEETKSKLNGSDQQGKNRLDYYTGVRTYEGSRIPGLNTTFRERKGILGDMIHSGAEVVGIPGQIEKYKKGWKNALNSTASMPESKGESYQKFKNKNNTRLNIAYIGANDGFLHGFRAGSYDADGKTFAENQEKNDGQEVLAFVPNSVLKRMHRPDNESLDFNHTRYAHNYYHDSNPGSGDVFYNGQWHTWLVSGLGAGGASIYALDISNPDDFKSGDPNEYIKGEWSYHKEDILWKHLGNTYGKPQVVRLHNGQWGFVFGNGWCEDADAQNGSCSKTQGQAGVYIMLIDSTGEINFKFLNTGVGTTSTPNGIAEVTPVDLDEDNITDYLYAGDLQGNVWRFDVTEQDERKWEEIKPTKIFTTKKGQPITTRILVSTQDDKRVLLNFGTGKRNIGYLYSRDTYSIGIQSLYGIWDANMDNWNAKGSYQYQSMKNTKIPELSNLIRQEIDENDKDEKKEDGSKKAYTVGKDICWANSTCDVKDIYGWYRDLDTVKQSSEIEYEQVINNPAYARTETTKPIIVFNTYVDGQPPVASCDDTDKSAGRSFGLDLLSGKGVRNVFDGAIDGFYVQKYGAVGDVVIIYVDGIPYLQIKRPNGTLIYVKLNLEEKKSITKKVRRISWQEIF